MNGKTGAAFTGLFYELIGKIFPFKSDKIPLQKKYPKWIEDNYDIFYLIVFVSFGIGFAILHYYGFNKIMATKKVNKDDLLSFNIFSTCFFAYGLSMVFSSLIILITPIAKDICRRDTYESSKNLKADVIKVNYFLGTMIVIAALVLDGLVYLKILQ